MAELDWFQGKLSRLSTDENVLDNLSEVNIAAANLRPNQLSVIASNLPLGSIFDCVNSSDLDQINAACSALKLFLSALEPRFVLSQYGVHLMRALNHPEPNVQLLTIEQLNRSISEVDLLSSNDLEIIKAVINCLGKDLVVAQPCIKFLITLSHSPAGLSALFSPPILRLLESTMAISSVVQLRVFEVVVGISTFSAPSLHACHASGVFSSLFDTLKNMKDSLARFACLELLTSLALTYHGLKFLEDEGILKYLADQLSAVLGEDDTGLNSLYVPCYIKFFGNVAQLQPEYIFSKYPNIIDKIFEAVDSPDRDTVCKALETVSYIATTTRGKQLLSTYDNKMTITIEQIGSYLKGMPMEYKVTAMNALANMFKLDITDLTDDLLSITKSWFYKLGEDPMQNIMSICRQPFVETRCAGLLVLKSLAILPWGLEEFVRYPGLLEFLLDRSSDTTMQCKDAKYQVIKQIIEAPKAKEILPGPMYVRMREYVRQGLVHVPVQMEVAVDGM
ncbi:unnamed protein product [Bemisia tabaci]|uniref:26S proteasome non-ATPase regulatory subunit 5 n=1 Tax=Bemisia tabaci TaxID=7038 RepID=A0A9P0AL81_BEMTA|nr:unnamed protein product [Bemisia tabaci]